MSYNLLDQHWIPVLYQDGRSVRVGIRAALTEAGVIRQIAASNPMDNVALLRFLLAVLHWCKPSLSGPECARLDGADGIPADWLSRLGSAAKPKETFDLLGEGDRFYQHKENVGKDRPIGDLLVEFPTETKIAHLRHVRDMEYGLCPACCALGIVRFCSFANAYGGGRYTAAVNGPTPAYAIAHGPTVLETLRLEWPVPSALKGRPPWERKQKPSATDIDMVTAFAWRSRSLWLADPEADGDCAYCSTRSALIRHLAFTGNWKPPCKPKGQKKKFWEQDPHLLLVDVDRAEDDTEASGEEPVDEASSSVGKKSAKRRLVKTTLGFPSPGSRVAAHARFWRRALGAIIAGEADGSGVAATMMVAGPAANKGLYQDATAVCLRVPSARGGTAEALAGQDSGVRALPRLLRGSTPNPKRQHRNRIAALDALSQSMEADLRAHLLGSAGAGPELGPRLQSVVAAVVMATSPGSPLRTREALERAKCALEEVARNTTPQASAGPAGGSRNAVPRGPAKPKQTRRRRKRKGGTQ